MTKQELFGRLLNSYESSYDIEHSFHIKDDIYDAHAFFSVTSAKYVLVKKAELWRVNCFEHVFFRCLEELSEEDVGRFREQVESYIEPELVRGGSAFPVKDHMYTFMTCIYICDGVGDEAEKQIRKFRYVKNYMLGIRGYSEVRLLVFDMKEKRIFGNRAAKEMVKGYKKAGIF